MAFFLKSMGIEQPFEPSGPGHGHIASVTVGLSLTTD
jgi:hypothetical protein